MNRYTECNTALLSRLLIDQGLAPPDVADEWFDPAGEESIPPARSEIDAGDAEPSELSTAKRAAT